MLYIGNLDKEKLGEYKDKVITDEVVLTEERIVHIQEHHPGDYEEYHEYINDIIANPDYVIKDSRNSDTMLFLKNIQEKNRNVQVVIKLNTNMKENDKKNSILTFWKVKEKNYNQMIRNKEIIWKKRKNKKGE